MVLVFILTLFLSVFAINESLNETNTSLQDLNLTPEINISVNISVEIDQTEDNQSVINETLPTLNETEEINLEKIAEQHKDKLNEKTKEYLRTIKDKKEEKDYIIKFKESIDKDKLAKISIKEEHSKFNAVTVEGKAEDIGELLEEPDVEYLELDQNIETLSDNVPYGIKKTNAPNVWNTTKGNGVKVAILDTGISAHSDLYVVDGTSIVSNDYYDNHGHGTSIAGILSAIINDEGLAGIAPEADIFAVKIMEGSSGSLSDAIEGVEWSINNNIDIISMSFGMETYSQIFKEVLEEAYSEGILLISASGNTGGNNILYPAAYTDVIAVGAIDENDERASFSNYGFELELVAAGVDINSTDLDDGYSIHSGTSLAVPHVAGVAALVKAYNNSLTNEQIRAKLRNDALDLGEQGKDDYYGYGLVQVNLESSDYILENISYFYEIFNITNYGTENQEYLFWLNGTGTIDDVDFSEGYYLVKKYVGDEIYEDKYAVDENGTLKLLWWTGFYDDFTTESSSSDDGKAWKDNTLQLFVNDPPEGIDAECYDFDDDGTFEDCYYDDVEAWSDCLYYSCYNATGKGDTFCSVCCAEGCSGTCHEGIGNNHDAPTSSIGQIDGTILIYKFCNGTEYEPLWDEQSGSYYLFDKKRALCTGSTTFDYQGRWSTTPNWQTYKSTSCSAGYTCDYSLDEDEVDTKTGTIPSPCVYDGSKCNGTINVYSQYLDGSGAEGSYVHLNGASQGNTDSVGWKGLSLSGKTCGEDQNISVYCPDNETKLCGIQKTSLDFNGDSDSLFFDCNLCKEDKNLWVEINDISTKWSSGNSYTLTITVHSQNINENNLNVTVKGQGKDTGLIEKEEDDIISVTGTCSYNASVTMDMTDINYLHVYVDPDNKAADEPAGDNYILMPFVKKKLKANLSINTNYPKVDATIKNYLSFYIDDVSQSQSNAIIAIGKNTNERKAYNSNTFNLGSNPFGVSGSQINTKTESVKNPYAGIIGSYQPTASKPLVFIYGNRIEGTIAALKEFISARDVFLSDNYYNNLDQLHGGSKLVILDDYDTTALGVMDLMHNDENNPYFLKDGFEDVITDILNDNNFEISIKTVKTTNDNTTLRLKHANTDYSTNFQDAVVGTQKPVVLSRGIHSNLLTWNEFASDLATDPDNARDAWLIEMVGGPTIDEDCNTYNCPDYTFSDLKTYYWPALISGVEYYSGQNTIDYVGHSLGCSAALESLELYGGSGKNNAGYCFNSDTGLYEYCDLATNPVDTFVAVACPGNFSKLSLYMYHANKTEKTNNLIQYMKNKGKTHPTQKEVIKNVIAKDPDLKPSLRWLFAQTASFFLGSDNKMSIEVYQEFIDWMNNASLPEIGKNVNLNNFMIIQGRFTEGNQRNIETDKIVSTQDQKEICNNIQSNNKYYINFDDMDHGYLSQWDNVKEVIKDFLEDDDIDEIENLIFNQDCSEIGGD